MLRSVTRLYRPLYGAIAIGFLTTLAVILVLQDLSFLTRVELNVYDFHMQRRAQQPAPHNIMLVNLDQQTIEDLGNNRYPLRRHFMASVVSFLHRSQAKAVCLDFLFLDPTRPSDDQALTGAIRRAGNVVVAEKLDAPNLSQYVASDVSLKAPIDPIARASAAVGVANVSTSTIRSVDLQQTGPGGKQFPFFAAQCAAVALHRPWQEVVRGLPNTLWLNYLGPQHPGNLNQQSFRNAEFEGLALGEDSPNPFRGKIVLVIPASETIVPPDIHQTPYGDMYGGYIEANVLNTVLRQNPITPLGGTGNSLLILLMGLVTTLAASRFGVFRSTAATLALAIGYIAANMILFDQFRLWAYLITPEIVLVLSFAGIMALRFSTEERQRRRTSRIFGQYVKPEIVDILVSSPDEETALEGSRRPVTVLFADLRGFTSMSETMEPEDVVAALDVYLEEVTDSVQKYDGTLDKYVGDEIMAFWNAPRLQENHALLAVMTALDMVARMDGINQVLRSRGLPAVRYGVGINSGDVVVGQMGSSFRKQYDIVGDTVNTAARLCGAAGGGEILIGQATWEMIGDRLVVEETEPLRLKGKRQPLRTYVVLGIREEPETQTKAVPAPA